MRSLMRSAVVPCLLLLSLAGCGDDENEMPRLMGALGAARPAVPDAGPPGAPDAGPPGALDAGPARPILVEAESGTNGVDVQVVTDAADSSITYIAAGVNVIEAPADAADSRIISLPVQFPAPTATTFLPISVFRLDVLSDTAQRVTTPGVDPSEALTIP